MDVNSDIWGLGFGHDLMIVAKFAGGFKPEQPGKTKEDKVLRDLFLRV